MMAVTQGVRISFEGVRAVEERKYIFFPQLLS